MSIVRYNPNAHRTSKTCLSAIIKVAKELYKDAAGIIKNIAKMGT